LGINGAILKQAKTLDIARPANRKISDFISQLSDEEKFNKVQKSPISATTPFAWIPGR
jgi:hypothetical protein